MTQKIVIRCSTCGCIWEEGHEIKDCVNYLNAQVRKLSSQIETLIEYGDKLTGWYNQPEHGLNWEWLVKQIREENK